MSGETDSPGDEWVVVVTIAAIVFLVVAMLFGVWADLTDFSFDANL